MMTLKHVEQLVISNIMIFIPLGALAITYLHFIVMISLNSYDNKRYVLNDGISSLAYGRYKLKRMND